MENSGPSSYIAHYIDFVAALAKAPIADGEIDRPKVIAFYNYYKGGSASALFKLGLLFHRLAVIDQIKSIEALGDPLEEAERCYRAALQLKPDFAEAAFNLAGLLQHRGNTVVATHLFRLLASQSGPQQAAANLRLAHLEGRIKAEEDAGAPAFPPDLGDGNLEIWEYNQNSLRPQLPEQLVPNASGTVVAEEDYHGHTALCLRGSYFLIPHYLQPLEEDELPPRPSRLRYRLTIDRVMPFLPKPPRLLIGALRRVWPSLVQAIAYHAVICGATLEEAKGQLDRRSTWTARTSGR